MRVIICVASVVFLLPAYLQASLIPVNNYTLTFERNGMYESMVIDVKPFPTPDTFYQVGGQDVDVYLEEIYANRPGIIAELTWYVNAPAVRDSNGAYTLLGGTGPLTITVSKLQLKDTDTNIIYTDETYHIFEPLVTHVYYVGYKDGYVQRYIPGGISTNPGVDQWQRSPVAPLLPGDPDYATYGASYGTPYRSDGMGINFTLPAMYVPDDPNIALWEISFGAGFRYATEIPEPSMLITMTSGAIFLFNKKRRK